MASYSKQLLSASTAGEPITISATATPGTTIHVAVSGTTGFDEMYVWASNVTGTAATTTVPESVSDKPLILGVGSEPVARDALGPRRVSA